MFSSIQHFGRFYKAALTKYQLHSPKVFELAMTVLEDSRQYYAFREVEQLRRKMRNSQVLIQGKVSDKAEKVSELTRKDNVSPRLGRRLFRLLLHLQPSSVVAVNIGLGLSTLYAGLAVRSARLFFLSNSPEQAKVAQINADIFGLKMEEGPEVVSADLLLLQYDPQGVDLATVYAAYMAMIQEKGCVIVLHPHQQEATRLLWASIQTDPSIQMSLDFWSMGVAFKDSSFVEKQAFAVVPAWWKIWKFM